MSVRAQRKYCDGCRRERKRRSDREWVRKHRAGHAVSTKVSKILSEAFARMGEKL